MKRLAGLVIGLLTALVLASGAEAQETLDGRYFGVDEAEGARIEIRPDPGGFRGTFYDRHGNSQRFEADKVGDAAEAVLDMDSQTVLMRMAPLPFGAQVSIVPFKADGTLALEFSRSLGFVREGIKLPDVPEDRVSAPRETCTMIAANSFLASYEFWEPSGVVNGYNCLAPKFRTLMRLYPAVQLDVVWKLCLAPGADRALATALRGQGIACAEVIDGIARMQRNGRFNAYKAEVTEQRRALRTSVRCADNYVESKKTCDDAARELSRRAVSLETAAAVLNRYR